MKIRYYYPSYEITGLFLWFHVQINSYSRNWNTPWLSQLVNFKILSGREDILAERYAIKLCFKLTTWTYGMLQTAFGTSCMNRASVFELHKRFHLHNERCGRSKEVRTPELIGQIKNFMDKDSRVSIETVSAQFDANVGNVHTVIRVELKMRMICAKFVLRVLREDQKERPDKINPPTNLWLSLFFDSTGIIYMHWVHTGQTVHKEYYVEVLREFSKRFRRRRPALLKSGQCHFHSDNALVHKSILVIGTVQQVHCSRRRLLRRGLEFHVCTIDKSAHRKKSGNLFYDPRIYIYIYIYICVYILCILYIMTMCMCAYVCVPNFLKIHGVFPFCSG